MRKFDSIGCYFVRDRKVLCVKLDQEEEREGLLARLQAEGVMIDGERVQIERCRILRRHAAPEGYGGRLETRSSGERLSTFRDQ